MHFIRQWFLVLAILAIVAAGAQAEQIENPEYKSWKAFKVGALVKQETVSKLAGSETRMTQTHTLKKVTDEYLVISTATSMVVGGTPLDTPAQDRKVMARIEKVEMPEGAEVKTEAGEETITCAGKQLKCKWVRTTMKLGETTAVSKVWTHPSVPGATVKMEGSSEGSMSTRTTLTVKEYKAE